MVLCKQKWAVILSVGHVTNAACDYNGAARLYGVCPKYRAGEAGTVVASVDKQNPFLVLETQCP